MPPFASRSLVLTERVPRRVRLSSTDIGLLLARYPGRFEIMPTQQRGMWQLTARGCAGTVVTPTVRITIRPKVSLENLLFLIDPTAAVLTAADHMAPIDGEDVFELLAGQFAVRLARLAAAGLHRSYREQHEQGALLQGRLDLAAQLREGAGRQEQLHYHFDDFTADIPCNQALKAIAEDLLVSGMVAAGTQGILRQALVNFEGLRRVQLAQLDLGRAALSNLSPDYVLLLDFAKLLVAGLAPGPDAGITGGPAFLLDMERVWEQYVTRVVYGAFAGQEATHVAVQREQTVAQSVEGQPLLLRPDIVVERDGKPAVVVDAKWKRLGRAAPPTEDLYQVMAYATSLGAPVAMLVYPGGGDVVSEYRFQSAPLQVTVRKVRVRGRRPLLEESVRNLQHALRGY
jgi:5-methylcytosine-specific restriction enzyme subunit McrC